MRFNALIDSNVIVGAVVKDYEQHLSSATLIARTDFHSAVAAHSYAEAYNTLTKRKASPGLRRSPPEAMAALENVAAMTTLIGLNPKQTFDAIRKYARSGGIGARLYDGLIGEVAVQHGIDMIVTWNVAHMRDLFPDRTVLTPQEVLALD